MRRGNKKKQRGTKQQQGEELPDIVRVGRELAARDALAFEVAQEAVQDWLKMFPGVADAAGHSDGGATTPSRMLIEGFSAATAAREAYAAGDDVEGIFNEQAFIAQEHATRGITKQWVVGFMQIRCIAIGYMFGFLGNEKAAREFGDLFRNFFREP